MSAIETNGSEPDQIGERRFEIHLVDVRVFALGDRRVDQIGAARGDHHHDAHRENPDQQLALDQCTVYGQHNEGDQRHARDAIRFEAVGARTHRIARVVARAIGDNARVARVVFFDLEDDLHQVGANVGDLCEDAARHAQRRCAERLANGKADETRSGIIARDEQQDEQHQDQLDADQQHADAHAGFQRNFVTRKRLAAQTGESAVRELANVFTRMPNQATPQLPQMPTMLNSRMMKTFHGCEVLQNSEVEDE